MRPSRLPGIILKAAVLAGFGVALSFAAGILVLGNDYYAAILMPCVMLIYALIAWLAHLRRDNLLGAESLKKERAEAQAAGHALAIPGITNLEGAAGRSADIFADPRGPILPRSGDGQAWGSHIAVFGLAAAMLAFVSLVLYAAFGLGASFFQE